MQNIEYYLEYFENFNDVYIGVDENGYTFISIESHDCINDCYIQKTKKLLFKYNVFCTIKINNESKSTKLHILTCTSLEQKHIINFKRLISAFIKTEEYNMSAKISDLFSVFLTMFSIPKNRTYEDFEGFFSELYFMYHMRMNGLDISSYWQSKAKMKFDFTFSNQMKLDVKSTSRLNRIHHFKHEQLASDIYDIRIVSLLIRKADRGLSINDLINRILEIGPLPLSAEKIIQSYISNTENDTELDELKFDEQYILSNIKFYDADIIPKFNCKQPNGVTRTEYDSDLTNCNAITIQELKNWIGSNLKTTV